MIIRIYMYKAINAHVMQLIDAGAEAVLAGMKTIAHSYNAHDLLRKCRLPLDISNNTTTLSNRNVVNRHLFIL